MTLYEHIDFEQRYRLYMAHHSGFMPIGWWKHLRIHISLCREFKFRFPGWKHIFTEKK